MTKRVFFVLAALIAVLVLVAGCSPRSPYLGGNIGLGQDVEVVSSQVHQGDLVVMGGSARIRQGGEVTGDLTVMGGSAWVEGQVDGNVTVWGGEVRLDDTAVVRGNLVSYGGSVRRAAGAQVLGQATGSGSTVLQPPVAPVVTGPQVVPYMGTHDFMGSGWGFLQSMVQAIVSFLAVAALGILLIAFLPKNLALVQQTVTGMWPISLGVGLLTLLVAFLVLLVLLVPAIVLFVIGAIATVTIIGAIIGIPLILLGAILLFVPAAVVAAAVLLGWVAIAQYVGDRVMALTTRPASPIVNFLVGLVLLTLLSSVPCIGWVLALGLICIALGAVVLSRVGTVLPPQLAGEPEPAPPTLPVPVPPAREPSLAAEAPSAEM